jgi:hypothetical protein
MKIVTEYFSEDMSKRAILWNLDNTPVVEFFHNDVKVETRALVNETFQRAEDIAEDYVQGVLKI